ncbi:uncharacterized protein BJ212DRAFT_1360960 [Suillus subaureus]|uniref:Uncharacterized protein n=1 Tax=Suillus subaureus TaxID=48587 RepID=A0A9P7E8P1_9AGAM|nr:uncharacterized protein BJ212DRAFT_1360960 [Suillus subaureus]KAG1814622.1 hypothetical protein BJ212DRAFT_1360960 [Suillus subaureus]
MLSLLVKLISSCLATCINITAGALERSKITNDQGSSVAGIISGVYDHQEAAHDVDECRQDQSSIISDVHICTDLAEFRQRLLTFCL